MITIHKEQAHNAPAIEKLLDLAFGPGRFAKSSYRLREGVAPIPDLCFVGKFQGAIKGSIRYWPVLVGETHPALLLGPLAVDPSIRGEGLGVALIEKSLSAAYSLGHNAVFLVGDQPYYDRVGFEKTPPGRFSFPGPVDPARLLMRELREKSGEAFQGPITKWRSSALATPGK